MPPLLALETASAAADRDRRALRSSTVRRRRRAALEDHVRERLALVPPLPPPHPQAVPFGAPPDRSGSRTAICASLFHVREEALPPGEGRGGAREPRRADPLDAAGARASAVGALPRQACRPIGLRPDREEPRRARRRPRPPRHRRRAARRRRAAAATALAGSARARGGPRLPRAPDRGARRASPRPARAARSAPRRRGRRARGARAPRCRADLADRRAAGLAAQRADRRRPAVRLGACRPRPRPRRQGSARRNGQRLRPRGGRGRDSPPPRGGRGGPRGRGCARSCRSPTAARMA